MTYIIDSNKNKFKNYMYKNIVENSRFSSKQFQKGRRSTTSGKIQESLDKIATCLNNIKPEDIPVQNLQNVCFILCNTYEKKSNSLGPGPLNDSYIMAKINHKKGYKVYYLFNPKREEFLNYLPIFLKNTKKSLMIYYSGDCKEVYKDNHTDSAIVFDEGLITGDELNSILSKDSNKNVKIVIFCDCYTGDPIWCPDFKKEQCPDNVISIYPVYDSTVPDKVKKAQKMHGIFTYNLCKYINEIKDISPKSLMERMNSRLGKLKMTIKIESTADSLESQPIFE